ncbi:MAG: signal peptidase I [Opitutaceae bacterium]|jgi:signal peptidase I|nr:signal peptidase I [Opitutaceae bacterium]MBP9913378.1 signal peptidase I [Opitutaceae bacterium]
MKPFLQRLYREWLKPLAIILLIGTPLRSAVVDWNWVPTGSMKPTIVEGDLVLVNKLAYDLKIPFTTRHLAAWSNPQRGDIVVCFSPDDGTRLVKRVVGLPGDTLALRHDTLVVNGVAQHYTPQDASRYARDIFEDPHPIVAVENLTGTEHLVLALPGRRALRNFDPVTVPAGRYFLMGDSRDNSHDSRFFGTVARQAIVGRASGVIVSFDTARYLLPRFKRFVHPLAFDPT